MHLHWQPLICVSVPISDISLTRQTQGFRHWQGFRGWQGIRCREFQSGWYSRQGFSCSQIQRTSTFRVPEAEAEADLGQSFMATHQMRLGRMLMSTISILRMRFVVLMRMRESARVSLRLVGDDWATFDVLPFFGTSFSFIYESSCSMTFLFLTLYIIFVVLV
ncbi:hypothetical protein O6H91_Y474700 [Diphasiastrum complanatum]|nr:hypothetical protein O6H91_Y474700 [Diphasiastrum complanatum]